MKKIKISTLILSLLFIFLIVLSYFLSARFLDRVAADFATKMMVKLNKVYAPKDVVLVMVDEKSVKRIPWAWPRTLYSEIFEYLQDECHVLATVQDNVVFVPDTYNPTADFDFYSKLPKLTTLISAYDLYDSDNTTGDLLPEDYVKVFKSKSKISIQDERVKRIPSIYQGIFKLPKEYMEKVLILAHYKIPRDKDDVIRKYMPVLEYEKELYPSQALYAFAMKTGIYDYVLYDDYLCSKEDNCKSLKIPVYSKDFDDYADSVNPGTFNTIKWYTPINKNYSHLAYSAIDILDSARLVKEGKKPILDPALFKDKIVIFSTNAASVKLESVHKSNILEKHAFADVVATEIDDMLQNRFMYEKNGTATILITVAFALLVLAVTRKKRLFSTLKFTLFLSVLYLLLYVFLILNGIEIAIATPIVFTTMLVLLKKAYCIVIDEDENEKIKNIMAKYISKDVVNNVLENIDLVKVGGHKSEVTIMFVDIRDFTTISENLSAQEVTGLLNEYFAILEPIIIRNNGVLNKYIGDAIMVIFGEPVEDKNHALNAIRCADEIIRAVQTLKEKLSQEGKPPLSIGVGINTGEVFVGNVGTENRMEYTVIGDTVNLASRIEANNHVFRTQFLISENTYKQVKDVVDVVKLSNVSIKGKAKPIDIYEVLRITE